MSFYSKTVVSSKLTQGGSLPKSPFFAKYLNIDYLQASKYQRFDETTDFG